MRRGEVSWVINAYPEPYQATDILFSGNKGGTYCFTVQCCVLVENREQEMRNKMKSLLSTYSTMCKLGIIRYPKVCVNGNHTFSYELSSIFLT